MNKASRIILLTLLTALTFAASSAHAAKGCYKAEERRAEQILRLHSELMVATVTCKQASTGRDLGAAYTKFTRNNLGPIKGAEGTLISHYEKTREGKGINHLDVLRTRLANNIGQKMADMSAPVYCAQMRDLVVQMADSPQPTLVDYASATYGGIKTDEPMCQDTAKAAAILPAKSNVQAPVKPQPKAKMDPTKKAS